jgi:hypothetical protein
MIRFRQPPDGNIRCIHYFSIAAREDNREPGPLLAYDVDQLRRIGVMLGREQEVDRLAAAVDGSIPIHPAALNLHVRLVHPPGAVAHAQVRPKTLLQFDSIGLDPTEDGGVVHPNASIQQHELEITVADRKHQIPPDRPQDHLGGELPALEGLIPRNLDRLSTLSHPTASTRSGLRRKPATEPGWQGKETTLRLQGWSRQRRIILLRRKLARDLAITDHTNPAQPRLGFAEVGPDKELWEYAALVTSLDSEILTLGQLYRDRADSENVFDELKNQWGWGGFTTQDLTRCRLLAGSVALAYNWWSLFTRLADPEHHREAITSRPLLLSAIARRTQHAGQVTLTISSTHGMRDKARRAYVRIAGFLAELRENAEQLDPLEKWYRILSEALRHFLHGRQLRPPLRLNPA